MKNKTYLKASLREIAYSKGRFIAIILIILLGTMLFVGIKAAGPILNSSASRYVDSHELSDLQVVSTGGLTEDDLAAAKKVKDANVEPGYQFFYADPDKNEVVQVFSYDPQQKQNQLVVTEGRLPKTDNEVILDTKAKDNGYKIGDTYKINDADQLKEASYKIVGFANSPIFISTGERGLSNVGNGQVDYFAYIPKEQFKSEVYGIFYLTFEQTKDLETYDSDYEDKVKEKSEQLETLFADRPQERLAEIQSEAQEKLNPEKTKVADGLAELEQAETQLSQQTAFASQLPVEQRAQLVAAQEQLAENRQQLTEAQSKIEEQEQSLADMKEPSYSFHQRSDNPGFQEYGDLSERIAAIANVFPVFFFFIAALITFTTMTRMVEENRREIGTLKALGYSKFEISKKYFIYALSAAAIGILLGSVIGTEALPRIIFALSSERYNFDQVHIYYLPRPIIQASIAFVLASLGSALLVLMKDLREKPAQLLQPKAPKPGKRIFLEYIKPLWARLSFNQKVSYRNLLRYKSRMVMAIIGISGCAGLMVAGVGLKDSLSSVTAKQFGPIIDYQGIVTLSDDADNPADRQAVETVFDQEGQVTASLPSFNEAIEIRQSGQGTQQLTMMVPQSSKDFADYVHLRNREEKTVRLDDHGAAITEKVAELFDLKEGDSLTIYDSEQQPIKLKISHIVENYLGNFLYMSKDYYQTITDDSYQPNAFFLQTKSMSEKQENQLSEELLTSEKVVNTSFVSQQIQTQEDSMANLDAIVLIFVVLSGLLAFVVLYNLTNINVSERIRELSTIKVLGFFDKEVTMYIFRENVIFTLLGIVVGYGVGIVLTAFILRQASMENVIFPLVIHWTAYVISGGLTIVFTLIVMAVTHVKLKHINMIDALKSNE
ncbi:FtsX-like permease family protein [Candidatus Enterococcus ferrettii]|uniref:ABC3 transporter permease C-terminal domain-containing protein n=1 Tax=Candidatus Enterococcus ferrettii TaxID=2815324 RepID=A0ABV0EYI7_9ENTE|nr:FtsX-like permease family protein [Enterococcus sp. 665A]MBO1342522.1 FtsX-like permease family protein [Enterococcus sp. 665A]